MKTRADILTELLVIRARNGEKQAFELLFRQWQPRLLSYAIRMTGNPDAATDVMQDVWLAISRGIRRLDDPGRFRGWIYRIVQNKCADWVRREQARRRLETGAGEQAEFLSSAATEDDPVEQIRTKLRTLPDDKRVILTMFYLDELPVRDIALALDVPEGTIKSRLYHARRMLKEALEA